MTIRLATYRHPTAEFTIPLPTTWERAEDTEGVALIAAEPGRFPWFRANLVVTIEQLHADVGLAGWADGGLGQLDRMLQGFLLSTSRRPSSAADGPPERGSATSRATGPDLNAGERARRVAGASVIAGGATLAGAAAGAAIGSLVPGVGTAAGAAVSGVVGSGVGQAVGTKIKGWLF